jgi:hypothetical protein
VPNGSGPRFSIEVGSSIAMCPKAPDLASLLGRAPTPLRVDSFGPCLPPGEGNDTTTRLMVPYGLWVSCIKKDIVGLPIQLGSRVSKSRSCVFKASDV